MDTTPRTRTDDVEDKADIPITTPCPNCGADGLTVFYGVQGVPAHSVLLMRTREQALHFPRGDIKLTFCATCGFISNTAFNPSLQNYSAEYEETQGFSGTFNAFHKRLADDLIRRHNLRGKKVIEIGCGKGEFLTLLCERGGNRGLGFDPAYVPERNTSRVKDRLTFIRDYYSEKYAGCQSDFICCKMTLEHIPHTAAFIGTVRRSIAAHLDTCVFFQVPDTSRILRELAFWDIYYEHCSYFTRSSLTTLFRQQGFAVEAVWTDYDDQYLMIEAKPCDPTTFTEPPQEQDLASLRDDLSFFIQHIQDWLDRWRCKLRTLKHANRRVVLWGGGSKAVAFLTTLGIQSEVLYVVDVNPYKHKTFLAGTGHPIVAPGFLSEQPPDVVIIMNPIYREEIQRSLYGLGLTPELLDVNVAP